MKKGGLAGDRFPDNSSLPKRPLCAYPRARGGSIGVSVFHRTDPTKKMSAKVGLRTDNARFSEKSIKAIL
ncbi:hypothetical protein AWB77_01966 [Caballeronia fortuita]|uniref:Uncharacterized protein n=2 Tax=Caballeronia fortuita TaxID=1777138 RepID=A0A158ANV1_9BURK|nr:hypothetical protein AWB77_01966 [Caballeronia fortuita]